MPRPAGRQITTKQKRSFQVGEEVEPISGGDWVIAVITELLPNDCVHLDNNRIVDIHKIHRVI